MNNRIKGVTFEKDADGNDRYVRFDLQKYGQKLQPLLDELGVTKTPEGWENALTPEEFLKEAKNRIRQKWDERNKV